MLLVQVSDINNCIWCGLLADDMQPKLSTSRRRAVERAGGVAAAACGRNNDGGGEEASGGGRLPAWGGGWFREETGAYGREGNWARRVH